MVSGSGQAADYFSLLVSELFPRSQRFLATPGTAAITTHIKLLCPNEKSLVYGRGLIV
jgi:hypothetical protein